MTMCLIEERALTTMAQTMRVEMLVIPPRVRKFKGTLAIHQEGMRIQRLLSTQGIEVYVNARIMLENCHS